VILPETILALFISRVPQIALRAGRAGLHFPRPERPASRSSAPRLFPSALWELNCSLALACGARSIGRTCYRRNA